MSATTYADLERMYDGPIPRKKLARCVAMEGVMTNSWAYTLRWTDDAGKARQTQRSGIRKLSDLAEHLADEVRWILLAGGDEIHIERKRVGS